MECEKQCWDFQVVVWSDQGEADGWYSATNISPVVCDLCSRLTWPCHARRCLKATANRYHDEKGFLNCLIRMCIIYAHTVFKPNSLIRTYGQVAVKICSRIHVCNCLVWWTQCKEVWCFLSTMMALTKHSLLNTPEIYTNLNTDSALFQ